MLQRATRDLEVKRSNEPTLQKQSHTRQQPHPSSPDASLITVNIAEQLKRAARPTLSAPLGAPSHRPPDVPSKPNQSLAGASPGWSKHRRYFASMCHNPNSFGDDPGAIDNNGAVKQQGRRVASVYIADDDLSDDNDLDLDFEQPSALPVVSARVPTTVVAGDAGLDLHGDSLHPTASNTSVLSWSQSSPSHYLPPSREIGLESPAIAVKRDSAVIDLDISIPVAKKRTMPKSWCRMVDPTEDSMLAGSRLPCPTQQSTSAASVPKQQPASRPPWATTASDMKAQKKYHRGQQKKTPGSGSGSEHMTEEIRGALDVHGPAAASKSSAISLSNEQRHVKSLVCDRSQSVFFTGPAGTGKSVLMRAIIQELKKKWSNDPDRLAVTASTGLAACNIGGMTLHSFAGIGLGKEDAQTLVKKIRRNPKAKNRWLRTKVLIIDEISMVDGDLFDKLSQIGRTIRNNGRPWGGIQLVITGDFFQLPPVPDGADKREIKFSFDAATWNTSIDHTIGLTEVFRQRDPHFASMLNEMRLGRISDQTVDRFKKLARPLHFDDGLEVTELFPTRTEVENSNDRRLKGLQSKPYRYDAIDTGDPAHRDKLLQNMMAPKTLELRKGAQVMLIKNMDDTLVNGSLGTVIRFMSEASFQAMGLGDGYGSDADEDHGEDDDHKDADARRKRIMAFSRQLEACNGQDQKEYPMVRFHAVDGSPRVLLCVPEEWKSELPTGEVQASRKQVPLILAWALSIHKAQGQTLERVKVDLGKVFEKGQAYVALSRATSQDGLQVLRFEKNKVMAHPRVVQFYNKLYSAESAISAAGVPARVSGPVSRSPSTCINVEVGRAKVAGG